MPKHSKQFVVFEDDTEMFVYVPEDDDHHIAMARATLHPFKDAKALVLKNLKEKYERDLADLQATTYRDFK